MKKVYLKKYEKLKNPMEIYLIQLFNQIKLLLKINEIKIIDNERSDIEQAKKNLINKRKIIYTTYIQKLFIKT